MREETGREQTQGQGLSIPPRSVNSNICGIWSGKCSETIRTGGAYGILEKTYLPTPFFLLSTVLLRKNRLTGQVWLQLFLYNHFFQREPSWCLFSDTKSILWWPLKTPVSVIRYDLSNASIFFQNFLSDIRGDIYQPDLSCLWTLNTNRSIDL